MAEFASFLDDIYDLKNNKATVLQKVHSFKMALSVGGGGGKDVMRGGLDIVNEFITIRTLFVMLG